jgi:hypothetical protein
MSKFDGSKSGRFQPYKPPSKWQTLGLLLLLMAGLVGMLVFLLSA